MPPSGESLRVRLEHQLGQGASLAELRLVVVEFAAEGGSCRVACAVIEGLGANAPSAAASDVLLDLLDVTCGFCAAELRVWSDEMYRHARPPTGTRP